MQRLLRFLAALACLAAAGAPEALHAQGGGATAPEFRLRAGDVLHVRVWPDSSLGGEFPVEENGFVALPILGQLRAAGRPLEEFRAEVRDLYGRAMKSPVVTVTPEFQVAVLGAVQRPGLYSARPANTLSDLIGLAGGFRTEALGDRVRLVRGGRVTEINAGAALGDGEGAAELALQSGDRIIVPERKRGTMTIQNVTALLQSATFLLTIYNVLQGN